MAETTRPFAPAGFPRSRSLRPDAFGVGALLAMVAVVAWNRLSFDFWLARHDVLTFFLPWYAFLGERLRHLDVPGWNPYLFSGTPFAGDPESGWMYLPAMLFFPFFSAVTAFKAMVVFQLAVAGLSTYAFVRVLGMGVVAALVGSVIFAFGPFLYHDTACCTVRAQLAMWIPLALLGVELALRAERWRDRIAPWGVTGLAISQMFSGWLGQGVIDGLLVVASYIGYRALLAPPGAQAAFRPRAVVCLATGIAVLGIGVALGAAGILPRFDVNAETNLAGGNYGDLGQPYEAVPYTLSVLLGHLLGDGYVHRAVALGGAALVLSMLAPLMAGRRFAVPYFAVMTVVVFTLSLGTTPLHRVFYLIPRFQVLHEHSPHQVNAVVMIGPAILSAATVQSLPGCRGRRRMLPMVAVPLVLISLVAATITHPGTLSDSPPLIAAAVVTALVAVAIAVPTGPGARAGLGRLATLAPLLILGLAFLQPTGVEIVESVSGHSLDPVWAGLWRSNANETPGVAVNVARSDPGGAGEFLQSRQRTREEPFRYVGYGGIEYPGDPSARLSYQDRRLDPAIEALLINGRPMFLGLSEMQGYNPIELRRYAQFMAALNGRPQNYHAANLLPGGVRSPLLNLLAVRYIVIGAGLPANRDDVVALTVGRQAVFRDAQVAVYQNDAALPYAWIAHDVRDVPPGDTLRQLGSGAIDLRRTALVEGAVPTAVVPPGTSAESTRVTRYEPDAIDVATHVAAPGLLVVSEVSSKGWRAFVDGKATDLMVADYVLRGVPLTAGDHQVELRYDPTSLRIGLYMSGLASVLMIGVVGWEGARRVGVLSAEC
jgi:hypothetical protein